MQAPDFTDWVGRSHDQIERLDGWPVRGLRALLDRTPEVTDGEEAPALAHWLWFTPMVPQGKIDLDGHPRRGDVLPLIPQPRRMWAGSDITLHQPLRVGDTLRKTVVIQSIVTKQGTAGPLLFVNLRNRYARLADDAVLQEETQILVYRDHPAPDEPAPKPRAAPTNPAFSHPLTASPALLFRYSAVSFNAHRIHYDADYTRDVEGYPGIILQGQLGATLMMEALIGHLGGQRPVTFSFRGVRPIHSGETVFVEGAANATGWDLWLRDGEGALRMTASASMAAA